MDVSHPLYGARLRQERALEHLKDIRTQVEAVYVSFQTPSHQPHWEGGSVIHVPRPDDPPQELSVSVGEMIYNLRAALDYVVFELARHDTGKKQDRTQFPIESQEDGFKAGRKTKLKGLTDDHVALVESYQPYKGCTWTKLLASLSNPDKHRELHVILTEVSSELDASTGIGFSREDLERMDRYYSKTVGDFRLGRRREMNVKFRATADVAFMNGPSVVETLEEIETEVRALIDRFSSEFE